MKIREALSYDDVLLEPQYSDIESRAEIDISSALDDRLLLSLPIIASPMDTISGESMATAMAKAGAMAVIHRYNTVAEQGRIITAVCESRPNAVVAAAVGVTGDYLQRAQIAHKLGAKVICIDVAHGHHVLMERAIKSVRDKCGDQIHIMAGNVATLRGIDDLADWGADSVRCNIGGGSICSTRIQTGHGVPGFDTILQCSKTTRNVKIIADGGIKNSGDAVKALAAGADFIMAGSILAGTTQTPGEIVYLGTPGHGKGFKAYRGMASKEAQIDWRGRTASVEGMSSMVPVKGDVAVVLEDLERGIRSGFSYTGARNMKELHAKAKFIRQTAAGQTESGTHILGAGGVRQ